MIHRVIYKKDGRRGLVEVEFPGTADTPEGTEKARQLAGWLAGGPVEIVKISSRPSGERFTDCACNETRNVI